MTILSKIPSLSLISKINLRSGLIIRNYTQFKPQNLNLKNVTQYRNKSIFRIFKKPTPAEYKIKDKVHEEAILIYHNTMNNYLLFAQIVSSLCMLLIGVLVLTNSDMSSYKVKFENWAEQPKTYNEEVLIYIAALMTMGVILQVMVLKMPLRVYTYPKSDKYTFIFYSNLPFMTKRVAATSKQISKQPETGFLPWKDSRYEIDEKQSLILVETFFRTSADLNIMLGYQKRSDE